MSEMLKLRRRPRFSRTNLCATVTALLLLFSVSFLHTRLQLLLQPSDAILTVHSVTDQDPDLHEYINGDDQMDELDRLDEQTESANGDLGVYLDHLMDVARRSFDQRSIGDDRFRLEPDSKTNRINQKSKIVFGSDDQPLDQDIRLRLDAIGSVEDALMLKTGRGPPILKDGRLPWFERKGDLLRQERMFRSDVEILNPLLQDPDMPGVTVLTPGDKIMQKAFDGFGSDPAGNGNVGVRKRTLGRSQEPLIHFGGSGSDRMGNEIRVNESKSKQRKVHLWNSRKLIKS